MRNRALSWLSDNCAFCHADSGDSNGPTLAMINEKYEEEALQTYLMDHFVDKKNMGSSFQHQSVMLSEEGVQSVTAYIKQLGVERSSKLIQTVLQNNVEVEKTKLNTILELFVSACVKHTAATEKGDSRAANISYGQIVQAAGYLKKEGQLEALQTFFSHENPGLRIWAATYTLSVLEEEALKVLETIAQKDIPHHSFTAKTILKEWDKQNLAPEF
jgi:hypothetical protein